MIWGGSATKETVTGSAAAREEAVLPGSVPRQSGWRPLPYRWHRLGAQARGLREVGEVTPGAEAAGLSPRGRRDRLRPEIVATTHTES